MPATGVPASPAVRFAHACGTCRLRDQCFLATPLPEEDGACASAVRRRYQVRRGERLYRRDASFAFLFQMCSGVVKTQRETANGGLVVSGFFLPGDVVGVDALGVERYPNDAIAVVDGEVCRLDFQHLLTSCASKPGMSDWVISRIGLYVRQKDRHLCWAVGMHSQQRILHFFLDLYDRLPAAADIEPVTTALPMQKQDIAHYLHMTPETLSRNLATLRRRGLLLLEQDGFVLPDPARARLAARS